MSDREALAAALEYYDANDGAFVMSHVAVYIAAARERLAQLPEKCGTCGGTGLDIARPAPHGIVRDCLTCHGRGTVYPSALVGQLARIIEPNWNLHISKVDWRKVADAVLDALNTSSLPGEK